MRNVYRVFVGTTVALLISAALAGPASAAPSNTGDTIVTFEVVDGPLFIAVPASAELPDVVPGGNASGTLGAMLVSDGRASANATWDAVVRATVFQTGDGLPEQTVLASEVEYWSGPATATTGNGTFTPGQATSAARVLLRLMCDFRPSVDAGQCFG